MQHTPSTKYPVSTPHLLLMVEIEVQGSSHTQPGRPTSRRIKRTRPIMVTRHHTHPEPSTIHMDRYIVHKAWTVLKPTGKGRDVLCRFHSQVFAGLLQVQPPGQHACGPVPQHAATCSPNASQIHQHVHMVCHGHKLGSRRSRCDFFQKIVVFWGGSFTARSRL